MDFKALIGFIAQQYVVLTGTTLALIFSTCMILLIRSIGEKKEDSDATSALDVQAIEGAMKRVLATQPVSVAAGSVIAAAPSADGEEAGASEGASSAASAALDAAIQERDLKLQQLSEEVERLKAGGGNADPAEVATLKEENTGLRGQLDEIQGRLAEYEIIEDDIADLSIFKEENVRLKEEIARLKAQVEQAAAAPAAAASATPAAEIKFEKAEKFELDINDDIMKEFAAAVGDHRAPTPSAQTTIPQAAAVPADDPQAAIDALLMGGMDSPAAPAPAPAPVAAEPSTTLDSQAAIDAMLFGAQETAAAAPEASPAPAPEAAAVEPAPAPVVEAAPSEAPAPAAEAHQTPAVDDPLIGTPDPDKMLSEVASLESTNAADTGDALADSLDTDKLLAEVDSLTPGEKIEKSEEDIFAQFDKAQGS